MDKKLKAKWLRALRGGQYLQTEGSLANVEGTAFCCLGVLADIQGCRWKDHANLEGKLLPVNDRGQIVGSGIIEMKKYAGGIDDEAQRKLAELNDKGSSFNEIADHIEANL